MSADDLGYALENNLELQALIADASVRVVINGHTHRPLLRRFPGLTVVSAGTLFHEHDPGIVVDFKNDAVAWHGLGDGVGQSRALGGL